MGARPPHVTLTGKAYNYNKNQPLPRRGPGLLCATSRTTAPTRHIRLPHNQSTTNSYRNSTDSQRGVWCVITSETGVSVSGVVVPGGVILGSGDRMGRASPLRAGSAGARVRLECWSSGVWRRGRGSLCPCGPGAVQVPRADRGVRLPVLTCAWQGGGCCTLARAVCRWEPRNHVEQHCQ